MLHDSPLTRQWILLKTLSARHFGISVLELAAELQVGEKTIRRDLQALIAVGFPLEESIGEHGRKAWKIKTSIQPDLTFAFDEALALYLGRRFLEPLAGTLIWDAAQRSFRKIRACLGKPALAYLDKMARNLHQTAIGVSDYSSKGDLLDHLMQGIEDCHATHIVYQSQRSTEAVTYEIHPYGLACHRGSLYLVAYSRDHDEVRHFKLDRIDEVAVSQFPFQKPEKFNLAQHLANSFGVFHTNDGAEVNVKVWFLPAVARYIQESTWHPSQRLAKQKDGSLLAEFHLSNTDEIKRWIMSFGLNAEALEPAQLRAEIAHELLLLLNRYKSAPATDQVRAVN